MENENVGKKGVINSMLESAQNVIDEALAASNEIVDSVAPVLDETRRLTINGYQSVEDAISGGVTAGKQGVQFISETAKEIVNNPDEAYIKAKSSVEETIQKTKDVASKAKDATVDSFRRRHELLDVATGYLGQAKEKIEFAVRNPREIAGDVKQHGTELANGLAQGLIAITGHLRVGREDIKELVHHIETQSSEYALLRLSEKRNKLELTDDLSFLDALLVGGDVLQNALSREIPSEILNAYSLQYPGLEAQKSFRAFVERLGNDQRESLVHILKGKLFEIRYVGYLNDGNLDVGYTAALAGRANQAGYDIEIHGPDDHISELIQAKATDSISYVRHALERYPDISVVTTSEVHSELILRGFSEQVVDGGITNAALESAMKGGVSAANSDFGGPSVLCLALLAFTSYSQDGLTSYEKSRHFGERSGAYGVAFAFGAAADYGIDALVADSLVGVPFISLLAASLSRLVIGAGRGKLERRKAMQDLVATNEVILNRLRPSQ